MKIFAIHRMPWQIFACYILVYLIIQFVSEADAKLGHAGWAKSDSRTKQLLQNIRSRIAAQQAQEQEAQQQQDVKCDPQLPTCFIPSSKEDDSAEKPPPPEVIPPLRFKAPRKTAAQLKKDVSHAMALKDRKSAVKKGEKDDGSETKSKKDDVEIRVKEDKPIRKRMRKDDDDGESEEKKPGPKKVEPAKPKLDVPRKPEKKSEDKSQTKLLKKAQTKIKEPKIEVGKLMKVTSKPREKPDTTVKREKRSEKKTKESTKRFPDDVRVFSLTSDSVQSEQCKKHSRVYLRQLQRYKMWALMMYDATAKVPSGILHGNSNQYGDFDECLSVNATFKKRNRDGIEGKYCLATIDISTDSTDPGLQHAIHRSQSFGFVKSKISDPGHFIPRFSTINWGLCIPSVCKAEDLENSIKSSLHGYKKSSGLIFDVKVDEKNCVTKRDLLSEYDVKTFITLLFYVGVVAVAIYASLTDKNRKSMTKKLPSSSEPNPNDSEVIPDDPPNVENATQSRETSHGKLKALVTAFSLKRNVKKLFIEGESEDSINCIHGIKSIFTMMLYLAHKTIPLALTPFSNRVVLTERRICTGVNPNCVAIPSRSRTHTQHESVDMRGQKELEKGPSYYSVKRHHSDYNQSGDLLSAQIQKTALERTISNDVSSVLLRGSIIYTDSFLLISGVLTSFNLCKEIKRRGRILWIRRTISRFIRLTPALLATLLFYAYISSSIGSGPIWNVIVKENALLCQKYMWRNLLYIQNFYPFEEMCAPQTHQLALDMQLFLLSPLLVFALHEYDKIGIGILQALLMVSAILRFTSITNNELSVIIYHGMPISQLYKTANLVYTQTIHRATPYIIGVIVGFYLHKFEKQVKLPNAVVIVGWITSACLALSSFVAAARLAKQDYEYDPAEAAHYAALSPIAWSIALGWFIVACHLGYGGKLNSYLSCRVFTVFSRISYSVYLVQFLVFSHIVGSKRIPEMFSVMGSLDITEFLIIVLASIATTLLFDIPTVEIKTIVLSLLPDVKKDPIPELEDKKGEKREDSTKESKEKLTVPHVEEAVEIRDQDDGRVEDEQIIEDELQEGEEEEEEEEPEDLDYEQLEDEYDEEVDEDIADDGEENEEQDGVHSTTNVEEDVDFWGDKSDGD